MISPESGDTQTSVSRAVPSEQKTIGFRVIRGAVSSIARKIAVAPISLLLVPYTLHKVGAAGYGTWAILVAIIGMTWLMDPGLSPTITKYIAEHSGQGDINQIRRVLDASCALCLLISGVAVCTLWFCAPGIIGAFFRGPDSPPASQIMSLWPLVLATMAASLMTTPFVSAINGRQRLDLTNALIFSAELFSASLTVAFLFAGLKVRGLLLARLLTSLFILLGSILITRHLLPSVRPNPLRCEFGTVRKIGMFSLPLYSGYVMSTLQGQLEKLYLARFVGVVPVGWYNIASEGASKIQRIPDLLLGPVLAAASELDATKERCKVGELYFRTHKYLALTAVPLVIFAVVTAKTLMSLWVGSRLAVIALPFALLVIGNLFAQMGTPTYFVLVGRGILRPAVYTALVAGGLNIVLSFFFIRRWGFSGAVMGTVLPIVISNIYFVIKSRQYFDIPFHQILRRAYLKPLLCSFAAASTIPVVGVLGLRTWQNLIAMVAAYGIVYIAGIVITRFFDSADFARAEGHLRSLRPTRRAVPVS
jgi:O-antigen/teichoic acid export membrane protein